MSLPQPIYLITDGGKLRVRGLLVERIRTALEASNGRVAFVQLREQVPDGQHAVADDEELNQLITQLAPICEAQRAKLIVNRRPDLLGQSKISGIHLGSSIEALRKNRSAHPAAILGYSAHSVAECRTAESAGASYILLSPIYPPLSKPSAGPELGVEQLAEAATQVMIPIYALGGITTQRVAACRSAGASGVAMLSSILLAPDPAQATQQALNAWQQNS